MLSVSLFYAHETKKEKIKTKLHTSEILFCERETRQNTRETKFCERVTIYCEESVFCTAIEEYVIY